MLVMLKYLFLLFIVFGVVSCKTGSDRQKETEAELPVKYARYDDIKVSRFVIEGIISDLSSILEEAVVVKELGVFKALTG